MAAFGRDIPIRLEIEGVCYIPAGMGRHSECLTDDRGIPLPSGDPVYEPSTWNGVTLRCTPNSRCLEHHFWAERRCACDKYAVFDPDKGTCSGQGYVYAHLALLSILSILVLV